MVENEKELQDNQVIQEAPQDTVVEEEIPEENVQTEVAQAESQSVEDKNLARLRELREIAEKERDEALKARLEMERQLQSYQQQYSGNLQAQQAYTQPRPPVYDTLNPDDLVEGRHLSKYDQEMKQLKQSIEQQQAMVQVQNQMSQLRTKYKDFDSVVSEDNVRILNAKYPSIAQSLRNSPDLNSLGESAYEIIKKFGIHQEDTYQESKQRAQLNSAKPRPMGSSSPLAQASQYDRSYTEEMLDRDRIEMEEAIRNNR